MSCEASFVFHSFIRSHHFGDRPLFPGRSIAIRQPGIPCSLPILFGCPTLRFQEMKIGGGIWPLTKVARNQKRVIDSIALDLLAIQSIANAVIIGIRKIAVLEFLERSVC